jgi:predicted transcriptional regulator
MAVGQQRTAIDLVVARIIDQLVSVRPTTSVADAHRAMWQRRATRLPVLEGTRAVGSISLVTVASLGFEGGAILVRDVMDAPLPELDEHASVAAVADAIAAADAVLVLRESFPIGLLTEADLRLEQGISRDAPAPPQPLPVIL